MTDGSDRVDVPYTWAQTLRVPIRPPKLVYLDLNHWIELAKTLSGHPDGRSHAPALAACTDAAAQGRAVFPISDSIYGEISKIRQYRRRRDLRLVIEEVSRFKVVTSRSVISVHEVEALLDRLVGPNPHPINSMDYLDWGVARAFGMAGGFQVKSATGDDITDEVRSKHPAGPEAFDLRLAQAELELNRKTIEGPRLDEEPELRESGWNPRAALEVSERRAAQEVEQVSRFDDDPRWRRGRIRDVVAAREVLIEINETLQRGLSERGVKAEEVFTRVEETRGAFDSMPSFDVAVTLKTELHRDPQHRWTTNDVHDIDALGSTVPYCDIVVTDKAMASHVNHAGLAERLDAVVISPLADLPAHLE